MKLRSVEYLKVFDSIPWSLSKLKEYLFRTDSVWECKIVHSSCEIWPKYWIMWSLVADKIISFLEKVCFCMIVLRKKLQSYFKKWILLYILTINTLFSSPIFWEEKLSGFRNILPPHEEITMESLHFFESSQRFIRGFGKVRGFREWLYAKILTKEKWHQKDDKLF